MKFWGKESGGRGGNVVVHPGDAHFLSTKDIDLPGYSIIAVRYQDRG